MTILQIAIFLKEKIRPFLIYKKFKMGSIVVAYNFLLTYIHFEFSGSEDAGTTLLIRINSLHSSLTTTAKNG